VDRARQAQARFGINLPGMNYECDRNRAFRVNRVSSAPGSSVEVHVTNHFEKINKRF
jgi:hypothetical protein